MLHRFGDESVAILLEAVDLFDEIERQGDGDAPVVATELADTDLSEWGASLPAGDEGLVDEAGGTPVRWIEGQGWVDDSA